MRNSKIDDSNGIVENVSSLLPWRVVHLPYPRETQEYSRLSIRWVQYRKIKIPKIFIQKKTLEKQEASVNYDLLCGHIESFLNSEAQGYDLFSINSTHSGLFSMTQAPVHAHHPFLRKRIPSSTLQGKEVLIIVLKRKE